MLWINKKLRARTDPSMTNEAGELYCLIDVTDRPGFVR